MICIYNHSHRVKIPVVTQSSLTNHAKCLQNRYRLQGPLTLYPHLATRTILGESRIVRKKINRFCQQICGSETLLDRCFENCPSLRLGSFGKPSLNVHCLLKFNEASVANMQCVQKPQKQIKLSIIARLECMHNVNSLCIGTAKYCSRIIPSKIRG